MAGASEAVRVGLIGAGRMGARHLAALERCPSTIVAGVAEAAPATRAALAAAGHSVYADVDDLLGAPDVEAVLIAAPSDLHRSLVAATARSGLPTLCEKPVGLRAAETAAAVDCAYRGGVLLQVGYWRRFVPELIRLRARIAAGELGEISQLACMQWDGEPPGSAFRARSGGIAADMAVHEFDQARWLIAQEPVWVTAAPGADAAGLDPDAAVFLAAMSGGAALTVSVGRRFADGDCCWLEVFGTRGYERVAFMWGAPGDAVFEAALVAQVEAFADAVRGRPSSAVAAGGADAVAALAAAEAAGAALCDGQRHDVPGAPSAVLDLA